MKDVITLSAPNNLLSAKIEIRCIAIILEKGMNRGYPFSAPNRLSED